MAHWMILHEGTYGVDRAICGEIMCSECGFIGFFRRDTELNLKTCPDCQVDMDEPMTTVIAKD